MKRFSERIGKKIIRTVVQKEDIDAPLKNQLWNGLVIYILIEIKDLSYWSELNGDTDYLLKRLWIYHLKNKFDEIPERGYQMFFRIKEYFFSCEWFEIYDLIEFIINEYDQDSERYDKERIPKLISFYNRELETAVSAYRIINYTITEITSDEEIESIENALEINDRFKPVKIHLQTALNHYSDKKQPDYRNSIKESISAVESICSIITNEKSVTLGKALKKIEESYQLHPALMSAFSKLYGYTSDADGIRHKLLDEDKVSQEDAKFMLVSCSAFINYLIAKESRIQS